MFKYTYLLVTLLFFSACSTSFSGTGFLASYKNLSTVSSNKMHYFYKSPDANLSQYSKILIPEIKVLPMSKVLNAYDHKLYKTVSAYTTASYQKMLMKNSANYKLVDVAQKETMVMNIGLSMVEVPEGVRVLEELSSLPFQVNEESKKAYADSKVRLMIEVKTTDAMSGKLLARSVHVMVDEKIQAESMLKFRDIQGSLDAWLAQTLR